MPSAHIIHREEFAAAHRLESKSFSNDENDSTFGACRNIHGHNYALEVTVKGEIDPRTGMVMNLVDLMRAMREDIIDECDHRFLNEDVPWLQDLAVITTENLAIAFWQRLAAREAEWGGAKLHCVRLEESASNIVEYYGD